MQSSVILLQWEIQTYQLFFQKIFHINLFRYFINNNENKWAAFTHLAKQWKIQSSVFVGYFTSSWASRSTFSISPSCRVAPRHCSISCKQSYLLTTKRWSVFNQCASQNYINSPVLFWKVWYHDRCHIYISCFTYRLCYCVKVWAFWAIHTQCNEVSFREFFLFGFPPNSYKNILKQKQLQFNHLVKFSITINF